MEKSLYNFKRIWSLMNSKRVAMSLAVIIGLAMSSIIILQTQTSVAQQVENIKGDLTAPSDDKPFGGDNIGDFTLKLNGNNVNIAAQVDTSPSEGNVLEGWLVDVEKDYKLSLGGVDKNGKLSFSQNMVNPLTYNVLVITEEPDDDTDPNAATPIGGSELQRPFGL
jgi:hypothetical protein